VRAREVALASVFSALGVAARLLKHAVAGGLQFVNLPLVFTFVAACAGGPRAGAVTGALTFLASDAVLGLGPWTAVNSLVSSALGALWGLAGCRGRGPLRTFVEAYLSTFAYDVVTSLALYIAIGLDARTALAYAIIGLFLPVMGGFMVGVGPLTEFTTAALATLLIGRVGERLASYRLRSEA